MVLELAPANTRIYSDGQSATSKQSALSSAVAIVTLLLYTGWMHIYLIIIVTSFFYRPAAYLFLALLTTLALPARPVLWSWFCKHWVFKTWREYFRFSYLFEEALDSKKHYVFVEVPHGVFPMGPLIGATEVQIMFPGVDIYGLAATSVYYVPFWRHFVAWLGSVPATSANYRKVLRKGSVAVIVGGIAEMYLQHKAKECLYLRERKGYVRVAVEEGVDGGLVPVFHFGNSQALDFYPQSLQAVARKMGAALGLLYGRFGLPLPRRVPIFMVCGKPIPVRKVPRGDPGYEAYVDEIHGKVVAAMQTMYDAHKAKYGWQDRPLEIL